MNGQLARSLTLDHLGHIPSDPAVRAAARKRRLLFVDSPDAPAARAVAALAQALDLQAETLAAHA